MRTMTFGVLMLLVTSAMAAPLPEQEAFKSYLLSGKEPQVRDATWMTDSNLYVGVMDNGSRRDGFAEYVCLEAKIQGVGPRLEMVKVVDMVKVLRDKKFVELGKAYCDSSGEEPTLIEFN